MIKVLGGIITQSQLCPLLQLNLSKVSKFSKQGQSIIYAIAMKNGCRREA
jgi:hypothetical protein